MSSEAITRNDLSTILNGIIHGKPSEYRKLLWENSNITGSFAPQTVSINLSGYDKVSVEWMHNVNTADSRSQRYFDECPVGEQTDLFVTRPDTWLIQIRNVKADVNGVTFGDCKLGSNATVYNNHCVPLHIYGIKYQRVAPPQVEFPNYSTEEQQVGTWIDRKPIYRKVIVATNLTAGVNTITAPSNVDTFVTLRGMEKESGGAQAPIPKAHVNTFAYQIGVYYASGNIYIEVGSNLTSITVAYIICEYTKTTD